MCKQLWLRAAGVPWLRDRCHSSLGTQRSFLGRVQDRNVEQPSTSTANAPKPRPCCLREQPQRFSLSRRSFLAAPLWFSQLPLSCAISAPQPALGEAVPREERSSSGGSRRAVTLSPHSPGVAEAVLDPSCPNAPSHPDVLFPGNEDLRGHLLRSVPPAAHTLVNQSESLDTVSHL